MMLQIVSKGVTWNVEFKLDSVGSSFSTENKDLQDALESSSLFNDYYRLVETAPEEETEESEDKGNMEIVPVEDVKNCVEARDFLKSHGLKEYIYSKAQIKTEAERMGFSFPNL